MGEWVGLRKGEKGKEVRRKGVGEIEVSEEMGEVGLEKWESRDEEGMVM